MRTVEERDKRRDEAKPALQASPQPVSLINQLQRTVGNRAVTAMIQRYDAFEHAGEGDKAKGSQSVKIGGETLTSGEINALADLYGSPDDLMKANPAEVKALVGLVRRQVAGGKVEESEWDNASGGRYNQLNLKNSPHFSPRNTGIIAATPGAAAPGPDNLTTFTRFYTDTITAIDAANSETDPAKKQEALNRSVVTAGFAEHYVMDAFSAGHLFNKDDFIAQLKANLDKLPAASLTALFDAIAAGVVADKTSEALLDQYEANETWHGIFHPNFSRPEAFSQLLAALYKDADGKQAVYSGLVKVVHDELSTRPAGGGLVGIEVENKFEKWIMSGDRTLATSKDTQRIIDKTLETLRGIMQGYKTAPRTLPSPTVDIGKVTDFFPKPTAASVATAKALVDKATDATLAGTGGALIGVLKAELPSIMDALEKRGKIKKS